VGPVVVSVTFFPKKNAKEFNRSEALLTNELIIRCAEACGVRILKETNHPNNLGYTPSMALAIQMTKELAKLL
jgi:hypothetical protein